MGKPYAGELTKLGETYTEAMSLDTKLLSSALARAAGMPLLAVGSGGSLTAATEASRLHERHMQQVAKAVSPLELVDTLSQVRDTAVLFLSAGGSNPDVIGAFERTVRSEPRQIIVLCSNPNSPLMQHASKFKHVDAIGFESTAGRDGFLATNSLLSFLVLMNRAYANASRIDIDLPVTLEDLLHPDQAVEAFQSSLQQRMAPLWNRDTLVVLHGPVTHAAAVDLESKFTEAALGVLQFADYRNFAHGRHHWLAKRGATSAVLALITAEDRALAERTLNLIPEEIPSAQLDTAFAGPVASLATLTQGLFVAGFAGQARGIDPGRPGVPPFGSRIYNLRTFGSKPLTPTPFTATSVTAIERKVEVGGISVSRRGDGPFWQESYEAFVAQLSSTTFRAIVFDYDGTLCDRHERYQGPSIAIKDELTRLLENDILIGIATGRGSSVREDLRGLLAQHLWSRVLVGYYNGADIGLLSDDNHPSLPEPPAGVLAEVAKALTADPQLQSMVNISSRRTQIALALKPAAPELVVWDIVRQLVEDVTSQEISVLRSSHSIDVLAPGTSKRAVVAMVRNLIGVDAAPVLCIGDRGRWPGNDFALLREPCALSVDEVSPDPRSCWHLAAAGHRGVQATLEYLRAVKVCGATFQFALPGGK